MLGPSLSQHLADEEIPARLRALTLGPEGHSRHPGSWGVMKAGKIPKGLVKAKGIGFPGGPLGITQE